MLVVFALAAAALLAFANGANDNAKPVASVVGAGLAGPRRAIAWGTAATFLGCVAAIALGKALVASFSGKGLVDPQTVQSLPFLVSATAGAALTVLLATRFGLPVSTTHALVGAIVGAGLALASVRFGVLLGVFLAPLLVSPLAAIVLSAALYPVAHRARRALGITRATCVCVGNEWVPVGDAVALRPGLVVDDARSCAERYGGSVVGIRADAVAGALHWTSALSLSFGRGLQDGAKIAGLAILATGESFSLAVALGIAAVMAAGGMLGARRVEETMAYRVTRMNDGQGLLANSVATALVFGATAIGAPVSTTHVTTGALMGLRAHGDAPRENWVGRILLAWVATLPLAALVAAAVAFLLAPQA